MPLTTDEVLDVVSDVLGAIADKLRDEVSPGTLDKKEILELIQQLIVNMLAEFTD